MQGKLFFSAGEMKKIGAYCREKFPKETEEVIRKAEETAAGQFLFDCRWDLESSFEAVGFKDNIIDWLYKPETDDEWTYSLNRMRYWICLGQAYAITANEKYAAAFVNQLYSWVTTVKRCDARYAKAWRSIEAGFRLEYWIKAYQYFGESTSFSPDMKRMFFDSVKEHAEFIESSYTDFNVISNWGVLASHGLFMAGVLLEDERYEKTALKRLCEEAQVQIYRDGMQWEQSPMYHNEVLHDFLDVLFLAKRNNVAVLPILTEKARSMCKAAMLYQKPDHREPMMGDSDDLDISYNIERGALFFNDGVLKGGAAVSLGFDTVWDAGFDAIKEYEAIKAEKSDVTSVFLQESGNVIFRTDWSKKAAYIRFHCGTLGAGHGHSDKLHIDVTAGGADILTDAGRFTYENRPCRYEFKGVRAHNSVCVDGHDYCRWTDSWGAAMMCLPVNQKFFTTAEYDYCEGGHTGYMAQRGVMANRRLVFIKPGILFICDEFFSSMEGEHTYEASFHFSDRGSVRGGGMRYVFIGEGVNAVLSFEGNKKDGGLQSRIEKTRISRHYGKAAGNDTVILAAVKSGFYSMSSCLFIGDDECAVENAPVLSCLKGDAFSAQKVEAWNISKGARKYTVVVAHSEFAAPTDMFCADGCRGFAQVMVFDRNAGTSCVLSR